MWSSLPLLPTLSPSPSVHPLSTSFSHLPASPSFPPLSCYSNLLPNMFPHHRNAWKTLEKGECFSLFEEEEFDVTEGRKWCKGDAIVRTFSHKGMEKQRVDTSTRCLGVTESTHFEGLLPCMSALSLLRPSK